MWTTPAGGPPHQDVAAAAGAPDELLPFFEAEPPLVDDSPFAVLLDPLVASPLFVSLLASPFDAPLATVLPGPERLSVR